MQIVETIVGNQHDAEWQAKLAGATIDCLRLDQWQAQKNRFRKTTEGGTELAVSLERANHLHDGDILVWDEPSKSAIVAQIELNDVMVVRLEGVLADDRAVLLRTCFELGHALGNQHWPAVVKETAVYVPLTVDRKVMASVMKTHAFAGITYEFIAGNEVIPYLTPHEARRLFGGADATPHSHLPGDPQAHAHGHSHSPHHHHHHHGG